MYQIPEDEKKWIVGQGKSDADDDDDNNVKQDNVMWKGTWANLDLDHFAAPFWEKKSNGEKRKKISRIDLANQTSLLLLFWLTKLPKKRMVVSTGKQARKQLSTHKNFSKGEKNQRDVDEMKKSGSKGGVV